MYFVKYGKEYLHDPRTKDYILLDLSLETEENSCGYCDFTIHPNHPMYGKIRERDASNPIEVYDGDTKLFAGFIYELGKEFYLSGEVKCKGDLAYLNDSVVRPYSTIKRGFGDTAPNLIDEYFSWLINQHNKQVDRNKQFTVGINQGRALSSAVYIFRENDAYPNTLSEIQEQIIDVYGGYLRIRYENDIRYIDLLSEWYDSNTQILDFGKNLTDYSVTDDASEVYTYVIPTGARMSETEYDYNDGYFVTSDTTVNTNKIYYTKYDEGGYGECYDLKSFETGVTYYEYNFDNDESNLPLTIDGSDVPRDYTYGDYRKNGDQIYNMATVQQYGYIGVNYNNPEIVLREDLIYESIIYLKQLVSPKRTIEIKAVDMHLINPDLKPIMVGEYVRVRSKPHNFDSYMLCSKISLDLNNPENSEYVLGTTFDTLTGEQNKRIKALNAKTNQQYEAAASLADEVKTVAKDASITAAQAQASAQEAKDAASNAILSMIEEYSTSNSPHTKPTDGWTTEPPDYISGVFIWRRAVVQYGDGRTVAGEPVLMTGTSGATGANGEDAVVLRIDSSRGTVFKNNSISTVLSVVIYKGSKRITDKAELTKTFGSSAYLQWSWQRLDENAFGVISVSDRMISNDGFSLTISADEVDTKVTFMCELMV